MNLSSNGGMLEVDLNINWVDLDKSQGGSLDSKKFFIGICFCCNGNRLIKSPYEGQ